MRARSAAETPSKRRLTASARIGLRLLPVGLTALIGGGLYFTPDDPWTHPTWFLTMGALATWASLILLLASLAFRQPRA